MYRPITGVLSLIALCATAQSSHGADYPTRGAVLGRVAPLYSPAGFNWSGLYVGVHGGYGFGDANATTVVPGASLDIDGWLAGGQIGMNWQPAGSPWVLGGEVDSAFSALDGSVSATAAGVTAKVSSEVQYLGSARLRAGLATDKLLTYVTGGLAWANNEVTGSASFRGLSGSISDDQTHVGWTIGGGLEWVFLAQWTAKVEYLYTDLGEQTYFRNVLGGFNGDLQFHTIRAGVN